MRRANETHVSFGIGQFIALPNAIGNRSLQDVEENAHHKDENGMSFYLLDHVAVEESGTGSPVACVHGFGGSSNTWTAMHPVWMPTVLCVWIFLAVVAPHYPAKV
jgi:pimeloyl-ACP methyl ester carboxylesterase